MEEKTGFPDERLGAADQGNREEKRELVSFHDDIYEVCREYLLNIASAAKACFGKTDECKKQLGSLK